MFWNWARLFWVMLMLSTLMACSGAEVQPEPTPSLAPSSTTTSKPTSTPEPTYTTLPTDTPLPISTPTQTPLPTATLPPPDASLEGILFLDANGSGLQDEASFICPESNATPPSLSYFFPDAANCTPGELVTIMEPGLSGIVVKTRADNEWITTTTGTDGSYQLLIPEEINGQKVKIHIEDPKKTIQLLR